jgi:Zn finger protein HypA/HybF involved in hydrogenase expression
MSGRRLPIEFDSPRNALDENGEIRVGAFARRQVRRRWMFGAFGVSLIVLAAGLYWGLGTDRDGPEHLPTVALRCVACGFDLSRPLPPDQHFPLVCPKCEQRAVRPLWVCRKCSERFLPPLQSDTIRCPKCGSDQVGAVPSAAAPGKSD